MVRGGRDHPGVGLKGSGRLPTAGRLVVPMLGLVLSVLAGWLAVQGVDIVRVSQLLGQLDPGFVVFAVCVVVVELGVLGKRRLERRDVLPVVRGHDGLGELRRYSIQLAERLTESLP